MVWGLLITPIWGWWFEVNVAWTRYGTFNDVYKRRWKEILQFRQKSHFTTCDVCAVLKAQLADRGLSMEQKLGSLQLYRSHLHDQFADRSILWKLQAEAADPSSGIIFISTDGLDQSKFALPREPGLRANAALILGLNYRFNLWMQASSFWCEISCKMFL